MAKHMNMVRAPLGVGPWPPRSGADCYVDVHVRIHFKSCGICSGHSVVAITTRVVSDLVSSGTAAIQ